MEDSSGGSSSSSAPLLVPVWVIAAMALATTLTLLATTRGPGLSPDSANYLSAAINLAHGRGFQNLSGEPLTIFPPALSLLVATGIRVGASAESTVRALNAMAYAATVLLTFLLTRAHVRSRALVVGTTLFVAVSVHLLSVEIMAWTEPLFVVVCLALLVVLERASSADRVLPWVLTAAALASVGFYFRYAGLALIPAGAIALVLSLRRRGGWSASLSAGGSFIGLAALAPVLWMLRNHSADGSLMGGRDPSQLSLPATVERFVSVVGSWILPLSTSGDLKKLVGALLLVLAAGGLTVLALIGRRVPRSSTPTLVPIVSFVCVYSLYVVVSETVTRVDRPNDRLLSPLLAPLTVLAAVGVDRIAAHTAAAARRAAGLCAVVGLAVLISSQAWSSIQHTRSAATNGVVYAGRSVQDSPLAKAVARVPSTALLFSNDPRRLWAVTQRQPIRLSPAKPGFQLATLKHTELWDFVDTTQCSEAYLAWYASSQPLLLTPGELEASVRLVRKASLRDGQLYRIAPVKNERTNCSS